MRRPCALTRKLGFGNYCSARCKPFTSIHLEDHSAWNAPQRFVVDMARLTIHSLWNFVLQSGAVEAAGVPKARRVEIGCRLRDCRNILNLSQKEVASQLGVSDSAVSSWEAGERMPGAEALADVCLVYGVSSDYILFGTDMVPRDLRELFQKTARQQRPPTGDLGARQGV